MSAGDTYVDSCSTSGCLRMGFARLFDRAHACRSAGRSPQSGCLMRSDRPRGTPPGPRPNRRQVSWLTDRRPHRLPGFSQWQFGTGSPPTVAGAAAALEQSFRTAFPVRSRMRDRRLQPVNVRHPCFVNAGAITLAVDSLRAIVVLVPNRRRGPLQCLWDECVWGIGWVYIRFAARRLPRFFFFTRHRRSPIT
jgi:hypothetical protein